MYKLKLSFLINSKIILNKTAISPTKIIDSYKVDTGGLSSIVILITIPAR